MPVRFAGFNLGNFQSVVREHNGYRIELYANQQLESALTPRAILPDAPAPEPPPFRRRLKPITTVAPPPGPPDPAGRVDELTKNLLDTLDFMTQEFGPSPIRNLAVTPIPGGFGQAFQDWFTFPRWLTSIPGSCLRVCASAPKRPFIPSCWRPMKWRTNGGATW